MIPILRLGGYASSAGDSVNFRLTLLTYWRIVNKRKWVILSILGAFVAYGALKVLMETPLYTATVRLQIDRAAAKVVEGGNVTPTDSNSIGFSSNPV